LYCYFDFAQPPPSGHYLHLQARPPGSAERASLLVHASYIVLIEFFYHENRLTDVIGGSKNR
jgi:hypothetical protein